MMCIENKATNCKQLLKYIVWINPAIANKMYF